MSIHRLYSLDAFCNGCGRSFGEADDEPVTAPGIGHWTSSPREARRDMKTYGWKAERRGGKLIDLCPACVDKRGL